jgi:ketopantoate reductase
VDAVTRLDAIAPNTVVLLTTKVNASEAALAPIADLVRDDTVIVCVQNGLNSEGPRGTPSGSLRRRAITQFGAIFSIGAIVSRRQATRCWRMVRAARYRRAPDRRRTGRRISPDIKDGSPAKPGARRDR